MSVRESAVFRKLQHPEIELSTDDVEEFFQALWSEKYTKRFYDAFNLKEQEYYATWDEKNAVRKYEEYSGTFIIDWQRKEFILLTCNASEIINRYKSSHAPTHHTIKFDDIFSNFDEFQKNIKKNIDRKRNKEKRKKDKEIENNIREQSLKDLMRQFKK